jgi:serine/threonine protein kinase
MVDPNGLTGQVIAQVELGEIIDQSGSGVVYKGRMPSVRHDLAIKLWPHGGDKTVIDRFSREMRLVSALEHPHLIPIYNYGVTDDLCYIIMRFMVGGSLADRMASPTLMDSTETLQVTQQIASVLDYIHRQGVQHHNLKTTNILFDNKNNAFLSDLRVGHVMTSSLRKTETGTVMGDPTYLAPEQLRGDKASTGSDQYALGVMAYTMLTGQPPFPADSVTALILKQMTEAPPPPTSIHPELGERVDRVFDRALAKDADDRFETVTAFVNALEAVLPEEKLRPKSPQNFAPPPPATDTGQYGGVSDGDFDESPEPQPGMVDFEDDDPLELDEDDLEVLRGGTPKVEEAEEKGSGLIGGLIQRAKDVLSPSVGSGAPASSDTHRRERKKRAEEEEPSEGAAPVEPIQQETTTEAEPESAPVPVGLDPLENETLEEEEEDDDTIIFFDDEKIEDEDRFVPPPDPSVVPDFERPDRPAKPRRWGGAPGGLADAYADLRGQVLTLMTERLPENATLAQIETLFYDMLIQENISLTPAERDSLFDSIIEDLSTTKQVNFSAYYPREAVVGLKHGLFVYAFVPTEAVREQVEADITRYQADLGGEVPAPREAKQSTTLQLGMPITVVPESDEIEFEPASLTKTWRGTWTQFAFDFYPSPSMIDDTAFVRVSIQVEGIEIAHIRAGIDVLGPEPVSRSLDISSSLVDNPLLEHKLESQQVTPYQRIFVSYSRKDGEIARRYKLAQTALGNDVFLDVDSLRSGEDWRAGLARAIDEADVFQLFWSEHAAASEYCKYEWGYALNTRCEDLICEGFIRPVYWRKPMPSPPDELRTMNFRYVPFEEGAE